MEDESIKEISIEAQLESANLKGAAATAKSKDYFQKARTIKASKKRVGASPGTQTQDTSLGFLYELVSRL